MTRSGRPARRLLWAITVMGLSMALAMPVSASVTKTGLVRPAVAAPIHYKLSVLAGSSKYVVYTKFAVGSRGNPVKLGSLLVMTLGGRTHRLGAISRSAGAASIAGSMLIYVHGGYSGVSVQWRNLQSGARGAATLPEGGAVAAPNGWVTFEPNNGPEAGIVRVDLHTTTGKTTRLKTVHYGAADDDIGGDGFFGASGGNTLILDQPDDERVNGSVPAWWMSFSHPGVFHTFIKAGYSANCPSITEKLIACAVGSIRGGLDRLYTVHGKLVVATRRYCAEGDGDPAVLGRSIAWVVASVPSCPRGRLRILSPTGAVSIAKGTTSSFEPVAAFNKVVIASRAGRELFLVSRTGHKKVLVQTQ